MSTFGPRVLVIDDDDCIRDVLVTVLEVLGDFEVTPASSAHTAYELLLVERFDLVLLDAMMPRVSGRQLLERLRDELPHLTTPVVLVTARTDANEFRDFFDLGVVDVITKPFPTLELPARLLSIIDEARLAS